MDLASILVQAAGGALGGQAANAAVKNTSLGGLGNIIAGALGGGLGGQVLGPVLGSLLGPLLGGGGAEILGGMDLAAVVSGFASGGVSGALTALVLGFIKKKLR